MAYTDIDDPSAHFQTKIYTGDGQNNRAITYDGNSDMQPDFLWFKLRSTTGNHVLLDSSRGSSKYIRSNNNAAESTSDTLLKSFDTNGFTTGDNASTNYNTYTLASWGWKANGGTTASNSVGDIDSVVQANTDAGFAIVTYTGNGSANQTIGHGLGAVPKMILFKNRSNAAYWYVYHIGTGNDTMMYLNLENAAQSLSSQFSTPTTTTFNVSNENSTFSGYNTSGNTYVAYVFADVQGYSKFGSYVGNGNANGPFVYTGFKPAFLLLKKYNTSADSWVILDNKRDPDNVVSGRLFPDLANAESTSTDMVDFLSNGFKLKTSGSAYNGSGVGYIYMAFAENPFVTSTGIPTTAR